MREVRLCHSPCGDAFNFNNSGLAIKFNDFGLAFDFNDFGINFNDLGGGFSVPHQMYSGPSISSTAPLPEEREPSLALGRSKSKTALASLTLAAKSKRSSQT